VEEPERGPTPGLVLVHQLRHLAAKGALHDHHSATQLPVRRTTIS
jgi:hypothetical protein